jgi:hypothetical protein
LVLGVILTAALLSTIATARVKINGSGPASDQTEGGTCAGPASGTAHYPGGILTPKTFPATFIAHYVCRTSDPTIHSAIESGMATVTVDCLTLTATESGTDTWTWSNGRTSRLRYVDRYRPLPLSHVQGTFVSGEFKGEHLRFRGVVAGNPVGVCTSPSPGTATLYYAGAGSFGDGFG